MIFRLPSQALFAGACPATCFVNEYCRIGGTANQVSVPTDLNLERGQRDVPTDLLAAAKVTGGVDKFRYGLLTAFEDDVEWRARDANGQELTLTESGRDLAVARMSMARRMRDLLVIWAH